MSTRYLYILNVLLNYLLVSLMLGFVFTENYYFDVLSDQFGYEEIVRVFENDQKLIWLNYVIPPLQILLRTFGVAIVFQVGAFALNEKLPFSVFFRAATLCDFIFLIPAYVKLVFFLIDPQIASSEAHLFYPLSVIGLMDKQMIHNWMVYPLQTINLFELTYWFALAGSLKNVLTRDLAGSLGFVASTYGVGLLLWVVFVMFLTISLT